MDFSLLCEGKEGETIFKKFINFYGHNFVVPNTDVRINKKKSDHGKKYNNRASNIFFLIVSPTKITNILMKCSEKVQFTTWLQLFLFRKKDVPEKERKKKSNVILFVFSEK